MRVLSVSDFSEWLKHTEIEVFILDSSNNQWSVPCHFHMCIRYRAAAVTRTSHRISFRSETASLNLDNVKEVRLYDDDPDMVGTVFEILCEGSGGRCTAWCFLAD